MLTIRQITSSGWIEYLKKGFDILNATLRLAEFFNPA
jgi:hypothetical protein